MQSETVFSIRSRIAAARRVVIKIGTNVLFSDQNGEVASGALYALVGSIASMLRANQQVVVVSSGAVAMGATRLRIAHSPAVCAAAGQSALMALYEDAFSRAGVHTAQILLTSHDFANDAATEHLRGTFESLLALGTVPVVNENDVTSSFYRAHAAYFCDNDMLAALLAAQLEADLLILLTDVDGLYTATPGTPDAQLIGELSRDQFASLSLTNSGNGRGRGGIQAKLQAVSTALEQRRELLALIANGRMPGVLDQLLAGCEIGSVLYNRRGHASRG